MALIQCTKQLECNPFFFYSIQKWSSAYSVIQTVFSILSKQERSFIRLLKNKYNVWLPKTKLFTFNLNPIITIQIEYNWAKKLED